MTQDTHTLQRRLRLTLAACMLAVVVVGLGAFTRLVDAGLGCPDWPGCYGHLLWPNSETTILAANERFPDTPVDTDKTWPEMVHRYVAGLLGLVLLGLAIVASRQSRAGQPVATGLAWGLVALVVVQALFGMWTVTLKLWPKIVTAHLLGGFATLSLLWLMCLRLRRRLRTAPVTAIPHRRLRRLRQLAAAGLMVVVMQIALGGWTSANYAALACVDLPTCHGEWWPAMNFADGFNIAQSLGPNYLGGLLDSDARTAIHMSHRLGAILVTLVVLTLAALLWHTGLRRLAGALVAVLVLQVSLGITNVLAHLPLAVAVAHNLVGALLLLAMVTGNYQLWRQCRAPEADSQRAATTDKASLAADTGLAGDAS